MCSLNACADNDQVITFAQLPAAAQQIVNDNFKPENVSYVLLDKELFGDEYKVRFQDGSEISFEQDGSLKKVDCKLQAVPDALVPEEVRRHISTQFPGAIIGRLGMPVPETELVRRTVYSFDNHGNWLTQKEFYLTEEGTEVLTQMTQRRITYRK